MAIVYYSDLGIFRAAGDGDKLGRRKQTDIPSGSGRAIVCPNCQVEEGSNGEREGCLVQSVRNATKLPEGEMKITFMWSCSPLPEQ